jgi:hypothetical protein
MLSPDVMRALLAIGILCMAILALLYLRRRELTVSECIGWGLLIVLLPLLGPFLVITYQPGRRATSRRAT